MAGSISGAVAPPLATRGPVFSAPPENPRPDFGLSPKTVGAIRWTQVAGQALTILFVHFGLGLALPLAQLAVLVALGAATTLWATRQMALPRRLSERQIAVVLMLDAVQIGGLLALTGALGNPFVLFLLFPAILAGTTVGLGWCTAVCASVVSVATLLAFVQGAPPWAATQPAAPNIVTTGTWAALTFGTLLIASYAWRIAQEGRRMARALAATQLALEREQRLTQLDGFATAAAHDLGSPLSTITILSKDLMRQLPAESAMAEDVRALHDQAHRCRDILARFTQDAPRHRAGQASRVPLSQMIERLIGEHETALVDISLTTKVATDAVEPNFPPTGEVRHGLANLLDNAVGYARANVAVALTVTDESTVLEIKDDGAGFPPEVLGQVGEPFVTTRGGGTHGLGLFVACTFLTRAGAELAFSNGNDGAIVTVRWPRTGNEGMSSWTI
ncbi:MAG: ActS/PrrB/RegB family redox-sensitive histidine kinase [Pseudomonadota bacterium]